MKYIDRQGKISIQDSGQDRLLCWLYSHFLGRLILKPLVCPAVSKLGGRLLNTKASALAIKPFASRHKIDLSICEKKKFDSYNDFFTRKIKRESLDISMEEHTLISPCDGKLSVYPVEPGQRFQIKHREYTLEELLRSKKLASHFQHGYVFLFRLTVEDYHRYCYMDDGIKSDNYRIPGILHTVNPAANDVCPVYKENTREFCLIKSRHFGTMLVMEVGALMVGKIVNYHGACEVKKGQEKGRFEFGGSTIVVLLDKRNVTVRKELIEHTYMGCETIVKMGEPVGWGRCSLH